MIGTRLFTLLLVTSSFTLACSSAPAPVTSINSRKNMAADNMRYGNAAYDQADYEKALQFFLLALENNTLADFEEGMVKCYHSIAKTFLALGKRDDSRRALENAQRILTFLQSKDLQAQQLFHQASLALEEGQIARAEEAIDQALQLNQATDNRAQRAVLYHGLGMVKRAAGLKTSSNQLFVAALGYFQQAQKINESLMAYTELAANHYMQGMVYLSLGDWGKAGENLTQALQYDRKMENTMGIALDHRALGQLAAIQTDWNLAVAHHLRSYRILLTLNDAAQARRSLDLLIEALVKSNRNQEAEIFKQERSRLDG